MHKNRHHSDEEADIEQIELKGFSRSIAEIEWLMLLLVVLFYFSPNAVIENRLGLLIAMEVFTAFILGFHYLNFNLPEYRWKLAIETWVMIAFITWAAWNTGNIDSPLLNLYLLVIISSAITLGKLTTLLEVLLIGAFYLFMASRTGINYSFTDFSALLIYFAPYVLVAYITTMLASDVRYGRQMFKALSEIDEMTGLLNKRSFNPMLNKAGEVAVKYNQPLSVMMIDADNLKEVNDRYGHSAGDKLIKMIAETIEDSLRTSDVICRYGGDEFAALLPQMPAEKAMEAGERLRSAIENTSFDAMGQRISSSVSIGIATYPDDVSDVQDLLHRADEALYESKRNGRNSVLGYSTMQQKRSREEIEKRKQDDRHQTAVFD